MDSNFAITRIKKVLGEYYMHNNNMIKEDKNNERVLNKQKWCALKVGWVKINCGGAFGLVDKKIGAGVLIRDSEGSMMDGA